MKADVLTHAFVCQPAPWSGKLSWVARAGNRHRNPEIGLHSVSRHRRPEDDTHNRKSDCIPEVGTGHQKSVLSAGNRHKKDTMKIRITLIKTEVALRPVFLRLAHHRDEGYRARALRGTLPVLLEIGQFPRWFTSMPEADGQLPRSLTVRINLVESDPCHQWVIARLSTMPDSDRATCLKSLMAKSLGLHTDSTTSNATPPTPAPATSVPAPKATTTVSTEDTHATSVDPFDDQVRKKAHQKALRAFDIAQLNSTNH